MNTYKNSVVTQKIEKSSFIEPSQQQYIQGKGSRWTQHVEICDPDGEHLQVVRDDPYIQPFENDIKLR